VSKPGGNSPSQRRHVAFHSPAQFNKDREGRVVLAPLDTTDIAAIQTGLMRQSLLRHVEPAPPLANAFSEDVEVRVHPPMSLRR
jgi:hypothetical protein